MPYRTLTLDPTEYPDGAPLGEWVPVDVRRGVNGIEFDEDGLGSLYSERQLGRIGTALGLGDSRDPLSAGIEHVRARLLEHPGYAGDPKPYLSIAGPF
ncbi:MAG TPA: hypothetical protein VGS28_01450 [Candidatus Saccharimonadales bacterium]|nr:hypothetical protein [Candidatus Saccharimonadales bacterium]